MLFRSVSQSRYTHTDTLPDRVRHGHPDTDTHRHHDCQPISICTTDALYYCVDYRDALRHNNTDDNGNPDCNSDRNHQHESNSYPDCDCYTNNNLQSNRNWHPNTDKDKNI